MPQRVLIAIPVFNEEKFIGPLLQEISAYVSVDHILVVNDGSSDRTAECVSALGVRQIQHTVNTGKGEAIKTAFSYARKNGYSWIIFMDGDGQHSPRYLPEFFAKISKNSVDVLIGNRQSRGAGMPVHRRLSNGTTSVMVSLCTGKRILDSQCGYRAIRLSRMRDLKFESHGFQVESEMLLKLGKSGARFGHIPVTTVYGNEASSIDLVGDTLKFVKLIIKSFWW